MTKRDTVDAYCERFWSAFLPASSFKKISFREHIERFTLGLPTEIRDHCLEQKSASIQELMSHAKRGFAIHSGSLTYPIDDGMTQRDDQLAGNDTRKRKRYPEKKDARPKLTPQERSRLIREGKCFGCGEPGHISAKCPKKASKEQKDKDEDRPESSRAAEERGRRGKLKTRLVPDCVGIDPSTMDENHQSLRYFLSQKQLSEKQMRWANILSQFHFQIVHVQGKKNVVADALSRKPLVQVISATHHSTFEDMVDQYAKDTDFANIFTRIRDGETVAGYSLREGYLMRNVERKGVQDIKRIWNLRWDWFHRPIHAVAHILHPLWRKEAQYVNEELHDGWTEYIQKIVGDDVQLMKKLEDELLLYRNGSQWFGSPTASLRETQLEPVSWWEKYGIAAPNLRRIALRVLSQDCSSGPCEKNWSTWALFHTKKRNKLSTQQLERQVFCHCNLKLLEQKSCPNEPRQVNPDKIDINKCKEIPDIPQEEQDIYAMLYEETLASTHNTRSQRRASTHTRTPTATNEDDEDFQDSDPASEEDDDEVLEDVVVEEVLADEEDILDDDEEA
ncbi:hypothetical protein L7F22_002684 [Adiantum nelumboides]|nr:hypothetical protein [Adiantum nelumboides]